MLEIAGGILIAIAILVALPYILAGAYWALIIGIVIGIWFALAAVVGQGWAWAISIAAVAIWFAWTGKLEADEERERAEKEATNAKNQEAERLAKQKKWTRDQQARSEAWEAEEQARNDREKNEREARSAAYAAKKKADKEMCINALSEGRDVIGIDGRRMTKKDFGVSE